MAKLSAHGRELLRISREKELTDDEYVDWRRITRAYMEDGKVLQKLDVHFKPSPYQRTGESYSYGWKLRFKVKKGLDPIEVAAKVRTDVESNPSKGWVVLSGVQPKAVVISQEQILRAVETGDMIGICKACGSEQEGCEPDARNYQCESCGAHEVYGAEEMLMTAGG